MLPSIYGENMLDDFFGTGFFGGHDPLFGKNGRNLMKEMMLVYDGDQHRYAQIAGHGFRILAEAMEKELPYEIKCPSLLICGTKDHAGSCIRYNREWHRKTKIPLKWIEGAGHNSNTDKPEMINSLLEEFFSNIL